MFDTDVLEGDPNGTAPTDPLVRLRDAVDIPADSSTDRELMDAALALESARRTLDAASVRVLGELDARSATDLDCGMRTPRWLAHHAQLPAARSSSRVRSARVLHAHLPEVATALDEGRITFDHARVLADAWNPRIADTWPAAAALFAESTDGVVFERWRREVLNAAALLDADGAHDPAEDCAATGSARPTRSTRPTCSPQPSSDPTGSWCTRPSTRSPTSCSTDTSPTRRCHRSSCGCRAVRRSRRSPSPRSAGAPWRPISSRAGHRRPTSPS